MKTMRKIVQIFITAFSISGVFAASSCTKVAGNSIDYYPSSRQRCLVMFEMIKAKLFPMFSILRFTTLTRKK